MLTFLAILLTVLCVRTADAQVAGPVTPQGSLFQMADPADVEPMPLPTVDLKLSAGRLKLSPSNRNSHGKAAVPPTQDLSELFSIDEWLVDQPEPSPRRSPLALTPNRVPFSTSEVFPQEVLLTFPYRAIGKIIGRNPRTGGFFSCSGSVIARRLVLTAGHCVYDAVNRNFYTDLVFLPIVYDGQAPLGVWQMFQPWTTRQWAISGGRFPNRGDFGILIMVDQGEIPIQFITGSLGWRAQGSLREHFHQFGYPGNIVNGMRPQVTAAQVADSKWRHFLWGSDQTQGSSGGPLILNFGVPRLQAADANRVIGVVSFGNPSNGAVGSSRMLRNFRNLYTAACTAQPRNCL